MLFEIDYTYEIFTGTFATSIKLKIQITKNHDFLPLPTFVLDKMIYQMRVIM